MGQIRDEPPTYWRRGWALPWPPWVLRAIALVRGPVGPYVTAAIFALMALPVVLFDVEVYAKQFTSYQDDPLPPTDPSVITAGLLAVLLAAVVGSIAAVPFARRRVLTGWMIAVPVAWVTGVVTLPLGPTIAGLPFATGRFCFAGCRAFLVAPGIGFEPRHLEWWASGLLISPFLQPLTFMTLAIGAAFWAWLVNQAARPAPDSSP